MTKRKRKERKENRGGGGKREGKTEKTNCIKVGENVEQLDQSYMPGWKVGADILQDSVVPFYEVKHMPITQPNHPTPE